MVVTLDTITEGIRKMPDNYDLWEQHDAEQEEKPSVAQIKVLKDIALKHKLNLD